MGEYDGGHNCPDCGGSGGSHYPGCTYEGTGSESYYHGGHGRSGGMSTFAAIMCVIGGFVGETFIFTLFDVDVKNVPAFFVVILLIIVSSVIAGVVSTFKGR